MHNSKSFKIISFERMRRLKTADEVSLEDNLVVLPFGEGAVPHLNFFRLGALGGSFRVGSSVLRPPGIGDFPIQLTVFSITSMVWPLSYIL